MVFPVAHDSCFQQLGFDCGELVYKPQVLTPVNYVAGEDENVGLVAIHYADHLVHIQIVRATVQVRDGDDAEPST